MNVAEYTIEEHIHRFGLWTAARAASRSRLKNSEVSYLIEKSNLRNEIELKRSDEALTENSYRCWLKTKSEELVALAQQANWSDFKTKTFSFGLAAKIISIYIKTVEIIPTKGQSRLAKVAHPPIDIILLKNLKVVKERKLKTNWSTFDWLKYEEIINVILPEYEKEHSWKIEHAWKAANDEEE